MTIINLGIMEINGIRRYLENMEVDTECRFSLYAHGYETTFYVQRAIDGYREQNSLYGLQEGCYGVWFTDVESMIEEIWSILDK